MEKLKDKDQLMKPDIRHSFFEPFNPETGEPIPLTIEDFYMDALSAELHEGVPEEIRSHFATAQNLIVYSWFYYPFNVTAQLMAFVSLEFALRKKFCNKSERKSFKNLLKMAAESGLIKDEGFSHIRARERLYKEDLEDLKDEMPNKPDDNVDNYVKILWDTFPMMRNELAHGSPMLHDWGLRYLQICADFINQLFPKK